MLTIDNLSNSWCVQLHVPAALPKEKKTGTRRIEVWVGPRAGLGIQEKTKPVTPARNRKQDVPARSIVDEPISIPVTLVE